MSAFDKSDIFHKFEYDEENETCYMSNHSGKRVAKCRINAISAKHIDAISEGLFLQHKIDLLTYAAEVRVMLKQRDKINS